VSLGALRYRTSWRRPFEQPVDRDQLRRRVLAAGGLWFLLAGLAAALGFVTVLIVSFAVVLVAAGVAGVWAVLRRYPVRQQLPIAQRWLRRARRDLKDRLDELGLEQHVRTSVTRVRRRVTHTGRSSLSAVGGVKARVSQHLESRREAALYVEALRLNELGAELRRSGDHEQAAEQHLAALAILRELGDRRAEALTLNNLALALVHIAGVAVAVQHFEQALLVLRELGDQEHEGQVIANLGFVRRRQGRDEEAETLLHAALDKLTPQSSAYRQVEEQLRRAS
jgi:tetratricopeptide (TPR) repeat protein